MRHTRKSLKNVMLLICILAEAIVVLSASSGLAQIPELKIENPGAGDALEQMGWSVALDGDTMIAGAPMSGRAGPAHSGAAWVYVSDGAGGWNLQAELTANDAAAEDVFGGSVALSGDTAIIGAGGDDDAGEVSGAAYIFVRNGSIWTQQARLTASDAAAGDYFGSVSISGDTAVVGASGDDERGSNSGSAYVFVRVGSAWTEQAKLVPSGDLVDRRFGQSMSISADSVVGSSTEGACVFSRIGSTWTEEAKLTASDSGYTGGQVSISGDTVIAGASRDDAGGPDSGSVYIFKREISTWTQQTKLTALDASAGDQFGVSVSISGDTALVGAQGDDDTGDYSGSAYVFGRVGSTWNQQAKLTIPDASYGDAFGRSAAISGNRAVAGAYTDSLVGEGWVGSVYCFALGGSTWVQQAEMVPPSFNSAARDWFGRSVTISGDIAVVGSDLDDDIVPYSGCAYIFVRNGPAWVQQARLISPDATEMDRFGGSVSASGETLLVGASQFMTSQFMTPRNGSVYVFSQTGSTWAQEARLFADDTTPGDVFGFSLQISENSAIIGALGDVDTSSRAGAAYVFTRDGTTWTQEAKLVTADSVEPQGFGYSVSISGDMAFVGAPWGPDDTGSAYVFSRNGSLWTQITRLTASDPIEDDTFGFCLALSGDTAVVGAPGKDFFSRIQGAAYVFKRNGSVWNQQARLTAFDGSAGDWFGECVAVSGDTIVVGAHGDDAKGKNSGSAYVFTRHGATWSLRAKLTASDASEADHFGLPVAIDAGQVIVGSFYNDDPEDDSGAAYVYDLGTLLTTGAGTEWALYR